MPHYAQGAAERAGGFKAVFIPPRIATGIIIEPVSMRKEEVEAGIGFFALTSPVTFFRGTLREGDTHQVNVSPPSPITHAVGISAEPQSSPFQEMRIGLETLSGGNLGFGRVTFFSANRGGFEEDDNLAGI